MKTKSLIRKLASYFPKREKDSFDFVGLMVPPYKAETNRILLCLDFDESILKEALSFKPDLIITHHPFFFGNKKEILANNKERERCYLALREAHIPLTSYHTNFDRAKGGMNDLLAKKLNLQNIHPLISENMARGGILEKAMPIQEFTHYALKCLNADYGTLIAEGKKLIKTVAIIGGGGSREFTSALEEGYDIYISGDCPHHVRREIILSHYNYLDLPHEIESIFMEGMTKILLNIDQSLTIKSINHERAPYLITNDSK